MKVFKWIKQDLYWQVGSGANIRIGLDQVLGMEDSYPLSNTLINYLQVLGLNTLDRICIQRNDEAGFAVWMNSKDLVLSGCFATEWENYIRSLNSAGVKINLDPDRLVWSGNANTGIVTAKTTYIRIMKDNYIFPLKLKCFLWLAIQDKLKTWENLLKRGWIGPSRCSLCMVSTETSQHLLVNCSFTNKVRAFVSANLNITRPWDVGEFKCCLLNWFRNCKPFFIIAICISWAIWYTRNCAIFQSLQPDEK